MTDYPDPAVQGHPHTAGGLAQLAYEATRDGNPHAAELAAQAAAAYAGTTALDEGE